MLLWRLCVAATFVPSSACKVDPCTASYTKAVNDFLNDLPPSHDVDVTIMDVRDSGF